MDARASIQIQKYLILLLEKYTSFSNRYQPPLSHLISLVLKKMDTHIIFLMEAYMFCVPRVRCFLKSLSSFTKAQNKTQTSFSPFLSVMENGQMIILPSKEFLTTVL